MLPVSLLGPKAEFQVLLPDHKYLKKSLFKQSLFTNFPIWTNQVLSEILRPGLIGSAEEDDGLTFRVKDINKDVHPFLTTQVTSDPVDFMSMCENARSKGIPHGILVDTGALTHLGREKGLELLLSRIGNIFSGRINNIHLFDELLIQVIRSADPCMIVSTGVRQSPLGLVESAIRPKIGGRETTFMGPTALQTRRNEMGLEFDRHLSLEDALARIMFERIDWVRLMYDIEQVPHLFNLPFEI